MKKPLVALISATPVAIPPVEAAFAEKFPQAALWNILDDRLLVDADERGGVSGPLKDRMRRLIDHAKQEGADGVLLTCSLYGFVAGEEAVSSDIPVWAPDDAPFAAVVASGAARVAVVASLELAAADSCTRLEQAAHDAGRALTTIPLHVEGALAASRSGDSEALAALIARALQEHEGAYDAVLLAQYSLSPAGPHLRQVTELPVFSGPDSSAVALRALLEGDQS